MESTSGLNSTHAANKLRNITEGNVKPNYQVAPTDVFTLIISFIICPFMVLFNVLVIMAVKRRRRLQTNSNILLACLAATDALTGLITQPAFILWKTFGLTGGEDHIRASRLIYFAAMQALSTCSFLHLMLVTGERLVAINFTMHYPCHLLLPRKLSRWQWFRVGSFLWHRLVSSLWECQKFRASLYPASFFSS